MKKKLLYFTGTFLGVSILLSPALVNASNAKISVSANKSNVSVGSSVSITYRVSSSSAIGAWDYQITTPSNFSFQSCNNGQAAHQNGYANNNKTKSATVTCTFKANNTGKGTFSVKNYEVDDFNTEQAMGTTIGSSTVTVVNSSNSSNTSTKENKTYSSNNNLKDLSIEGYKLDSTFKKNVTKYSVELENDVKSIKIKASKEDSTASISGAGEIKVEEGINKIEIKVTAEDGSVKTYTINATVKEKTPIKVTIDKEEYTVVRKKDNIKAPNSTYKDTTVSIENEEVPALVSDTTKYILVGLKDKDGNINLYIYNEKDKSFTLYKELTFKSVILYIIDDKSKIPEDYEKTTITINKEEVVAYKSTKNKDFYLLYGMNIETGKTNLYSYDSIEETLQRYIAKDKNKFEDYYIYGIIGLATILVLTYIVILINLIKKKPKYEMDFGNKKNDEIRKDEDNQETE